MKTHQLIKSLFLITSISITGSVLADNNVAIKSSAMVETIQKDTSGKEIKTLELAKNVIPGQQVVFKNEVNNDGKFPAKDIVITNPIPEHMLFNSAYAPSEAIITYSTDGKAFLPNGKVMIKDAMTGNNRLARIEEYTFIRWSFAKSLPINSHAEVGYRATLK